jgi:hypothetical protein
MSCSVENVTGSFATAHAFGQPRSICVNRCDAFRVACTASRKNAHERFFAHLHAWLGWLSRRGLHDAFPSMQESQNLSKRPHMCETGTKNTHK